MEEIKDYFKSQISLIRILLNENVYLEDGGEIHLLRYEEDNGFFVKKNPKDPHDISMPIDISKVNYKKCFRYNYYWYLNYPHNQELPQGIFVRKHNSYIPIFINRIIVNGSDIRLYSPESGVDYPITGCVPYDLYELEKHCDLPKKD